MLFSGNIRKKIIFFSSDFSPFKVITNITKLTRLGNFQTKKFSYHLKNLIFDKCIERIWTIMLSHVFFITSCSYNSQVQTEQHPLLLLKDTKYFFTEYQICFFEIWYNTWYKRMHFITIQWEVSWVDFLVFSIS